MIIIAVSFGIMEIALIGLVVVLSIEMLSTFKWGWKYYSVVEKCGVVSQMALMVSLLVMIGVCMVATAGLLL